MKALPRINAPRVPDLAEPLLAAEENLDVSNMTPTPSPDELLRSRTWVEIDLSALTANVRRIQNEVQPARLMVVVKKDAYGHGAVAAARALYGIGVRHLGVAAVGEGVALRKAGIEAPIVHIGVAVREEVEWAIAHRIDLTVVSAENARSISETAASLGRPARVHLKVDTGMGRLGLYPEQLLHQVDEMAAQPNLEWVGLYSHLADCPGNPGFTSEQYDCFRRVSDAMREWLPLRHLGASGAVGDPQLHFDMLRVGIAAYGADPDHPDYRPVMSMKSRIVFVKNVPAGKPISYGSTFETTRPTRVGVVAAGYGNGYPRRVSNRGHVFIGGRPAPILGVVCMDQMMVDLNDHAGVAVGDPVLLFGREGDAVLPVWKVAEWAETISYEVVCAVGAMSPRIYLSSASPGGKSATGGE